MEVHAPVLSVRYATWYVGIAGIIDTLQHTSDRAEAEIELSESASGCISTLGQKIYVPGR